MPVVAVFQPPGFTKEQHEETVRSVTGGKSRVESPADWPVEGLLAHVAGEGEQGSSRHAAGGSLWFPSDT